MDLEDRSVFTEPVRLYRRETGPIANGDTMDIDSKDNMTDIQEKERNEAIKQDRQRQREDAMKEVAPTASKRKAPAFKKKTEQVFRTNDTPEERKRSQLRYEETLPWHIEEFDNKQTWVGQYEEALSYRHLLLIPDGDDTLRAVPVEKWYRFRQQGKAKQISAEDVEKFMASKTKEPRWIARDKEQSALKRKQEAASSNRMLLRRGDRQENDDDMVDFRETTVNADEIDFNLEEEFADDEENPLFEGDDDVTKDAEDRMRKDQLEANTFGVGDEQKVDEEEEAKQKAEDAKKAEGMETSRLLQKREKRMDHEDLGQSDESDLDSSDSENVNEEREREDKANAEKNKAKDRDGEKIASGASSKGTNTPSGRKKTIDALKLQGSTNSLKRPTPGSGNLSDASGNESSRPGKKLKRNDASVKGTSNPLNDARERQSSLAAGSSRNGRRSNAPSDGEWLKCLWIHEQFTNSAQRIAWSTLGLLKLFEKEVRPRSASLRVVHDFYSPNHKTLANLPVGDDTASERGRGPIRIKITSARSPKGSPHGSRGGSPNPVASQAVSKTGSRAASPAASSNVPPTSTPLPSLPEREDILRFIPPQGIPAGELSKKFQHMLPKDKELRQQWVTRFLARVKELTNFDNSTKYIRRKAELA